MHEQIRKIGSLALILVMVSISVQLPYPQTAFANTITSFTAVGTTSWTAPAGASSVTYLVVAGGGGGGGNGGGGGGGGGVRTGTLAVSAGSSYTVTVGGGGAGQVDSAPQNGGNSVFASITATGGGGGGSRDSNQAGNSGGSGGGGGGAASGTAGAGTAGQGSNGGAGVDFSCQAAGGGGGGAGGAGVTGAQNHGGDGGSGVANSITGVSVVYGGGGGGGVTCDNPGGAVGIGGAGGGGAGSQTATAATAGTANTGGGGGGGGTHNSGGGLGGNGGSGIVILSYSTDSVPPTPNPATFAVAPHATMYTTVPATVKIYLTSGSSWTVPSDWDSSNNSIEVIGAGGGGAFGPGASGGGGAYAKITNLALTPGANVSYQVGGSASGATGGDTYFNGTGTVCAAQSVCAKGGGAGSGGTAGSGGSTGIGTIIYAGGSGNGLQGCAGAGGGGAGGPGGIGKGGGYGRCSGTGGGGGGGAGGGLSTAGAAGDAGAAGGQGPSGAGGGAGGQGTGSGTSGTVGGGGGAAGDNTGSTAGTAGNGGAGVEWDASHGAGGGGGGGGSSNGTGTQGGAGGLYGGGGGGGGRGSSGGGLPGGAGGQGIIVITYAPLGVTSPAITMTATTATDAAGSNPVQYNFTYTACGSNPGTGGTSSGWQTSPAYTDGGLDVNKCYAYTVQSKDSAGNVGTASGAYSAYTFANNAGAPALSNQSDNAAIITNAANGNPSNTLFAMQVTATTPADSSWMGTSAAAWYSASWSGRDSITVDHTKVAGTLTNFPVYVNLADLPSAFWTHTIAGCGDIRVTASDGTTEIPREIVSCSTSGKTGELWFKAPSLSSSSDTTFYIYYGNAGASDYAANATYGSQNVWDANYVGVWHLKDGTTLSGADSTSNANNGSVAGSAIARSGIIDGAASFNGSTAYIEAAHSASLNITGNTFTFEAWMKPAAVTGCGVAGAPVCITFNKESTYEWGVDSANTVDWAIANTSPGWAWINTNQAAPSGSWTHIVLAYNGSSVTPYRDGAVGTASAASGNLTGTTNALRIGARSAPAAASSFFPGSMDEVRISNIARSAAWVTTEYNNENSPGTFYSVDSILGKYVDASGNPSATPVWLPDAAWDAVAMRGLTAGTQYTLHARAENGDGITTAFSDTSAAVTTLESVSKTLLLFGNVKLYGVKLF